MKILYDHQMFLLQKYGGITKYFCELMKNLPVGNQYKLSVLVSENQHLKDDKNIFRKHNISLPKAEFRGKGRIRTNLYNLNKAFSKFTMSRSDYDLLHPTYYDEYFLSHNKKPYVLTVHDLIQFKFSGQYKKNSMIRQMSELIKKADRIISISANTKKDIVEILNVRPEKIDVIYHGFNHPTLQPATNRYGRYILYVGYRDGYKNFSSLLKVFSMIANKDGDLRLVCAGYPFTKSEQAEIATLKISEKVLLIGADENKLNSLFAGALAFVYPTLYEGFGMSILEAFANNCPVCLGKISSLPEVAGEAGAYFDPGSIDSIKETIEKVIYNSDYSKKMIAAGNEQLNKFSWKKCAKETLNTYRCVL
jgi:glycosyltransferase involved in cell wall biosynthesis